MGEGKRRILSIDGGGLRGTFPAAFLAEMEKHLNQPIGRYFDLIAGTSTGGLLAIGLGMGRKARDMLTLYEDKGPMVFGQHYAPIVNAALRKARLLKWLAHRKYNTGPLSRVIADPSVLGDKRIGDSGTRLVIPAWDSLRQGVYIYKTAHHERLRTDYKALAMDAALATAAAPTYFRQHVNADGVPLTDGGVWANNPIAIAVVEAIAVLGWPGEQLEVLSLGCLEDVYSIPVSAGIGRLGSKILNLMMDGQSHGAMGMAKLLTGHGHKRQAIYRVSHNVPHNSFKMDDARMIRALKGLGHTKGREWYPKLEQIFFTKPAEPFEPVYKL